MRSARADDVLAVPAQDAGPGADGSSPASSAPPPAAGGSSGTGAPGPPPLDRRRLAERGSWVALALAALAALAETVGAVVAGRVADGPTTSLVLVLGALLVGAGLLDTVGRTVFSGVVGRAEGRLRGDLVDTVLGQPVTSLEEQGVGELFDRVDDDAWQVATLLRRVGWGTGRALLRSVMAWVAAAFVWWPSVVAFPLAAALVWLAVRRRAPEVARLKVLEEVAWSEHSSHLEEVVAGRDDVRTALGQPHAVRQYALRGRELMERVAATSRVAAGLAARAGFVLHAVLAAFVLAGVWLVAGGDLGLEQLITLWLLVSAFVAQVAQVSNNLPDIQEGLGALTRIRQLLGAGQEPRGGRPVPPGPARVELRGLSVGYDGGFALDGVDLVVEAGRTCALVGRSGSGKSTLAKALSRAVEPAPGTVLVGGVDVVEAEVESLRRAVGVVTQRTELLAASLEDNITLFADVRPGAVREAVAALGLEDWVAALPDGLRTRLGTGGTTLSAGEEQLVAFARLLVRDVSLVVLDEATARMDPQTEARVTRASERLLAGRTGVVIAHRLSTTRRCDDVAVLEAGRLVQHGPRARVAAQEGPFRDLLRAGGEVQDGPEVRAPATRAPRREPRPQPPAPRTSLARTVLRVLLTHKRWGLVGGAGFLAMSMLGAAGVATAWLWGLVVAGLDDGEQPWLLTGALAASVVVSPAFLLMAFRLYPLWWVATSLRLRLAVMRGQTMQHRLARTTPGEVTARALDSDRLMIYADRWVDVAVGVVVVGAITVASQSLLAGGVVAGVLLVSALVSALGAPAMGRAARVAGDQRAVFGGSLVSALDAVRTVKLAAAVGPVRRHLAEVDEVRVRASVHENRVKSLLEGVPVVLVQVGVVVGWAVFLLGVWPLETAVLVTTAVTGAAWFGTVAGAAITEAPVARRWLRASAALAGEGDLVALPAGVDLVAGTAPGPPTARRTPLRSLRLEGLTAVHDDGTVGVQGVDLEVRAGELVLLVGRVGSGKSSLLAALAGLVDHEGRLVWNGREVEDPQRFLRPGQVAWVGQVPRVLSGTFTDNVVLDHARAAEGALGDARMGPDVERAGGHSALVGHRGVRLSGGQVQRLALARALATEAELLVADDVSSALDARTEGELWDALRRRGTTVVGSTSKRSALVRADRVVVLEDGRLAATGTWAELEGRWGHLAG
ncbi:ABC transporter ATP-binding protein [uncultured Pseudokineococcus sp.]|uniref:ABC transporter ATP-binding protein n=1 Tax=uncultured Pseudokineococcus sp. TaxID=1642928 RepID=UPI0026051224|nr:ABC transporter ATP-binding protein [uncultured Pseudokineococcus sp.]